MKKITAALLMCALALTSTLTACDKSGESNPTAAPTDGTTTAAPQNSDTAEPPASGDEASDTADTAAPVVSSGNVGKDFDFLVLKFKSGEFTVKKSSSFDVGANCGDEAPEDPNYTCGDFISAAFQQTANQPEFKQTTKKDENGKTMRDADGNKILEWVPNGTLDPNGFLVSENGDFWFNIDHITAYFYLEDRGSAVPTKPEHYGYVQPYLQMGGTPLASKRWDYWNPKDPFVNLCHENGDPESPMLETFGTADSPISVTWDIKTWYASVGETAPVTPDTTLIIDDANPDQGHLFKSSGNGAQKFGIQFSRDTTNFFDASESELKLYFGFTDVEIFVKDKAKFMEYVEKVSAVTGAKFDDSLKVTEVG